MLTSHVSLWPNSYWPCFSLKKGMCILFCLICLGGIRMSLTQFCFLELGTWMHVFFTRTNQLQGNVMFTVLILTENLLVLG